MTREVLSSPPCALRIFVRCQYSINASEAPLLEGEIGHECTLQKKFQKNQFFHREGAPIHSRPAIYGQQYQMQARIQEQLRVNVEFVMR
jgi:hypothetical protein